jgi:hypothetical protein
MATPRTIARLDALVWILIYGGLFAVILGFVTGSQAPIASWSLVAGGALCVAAGCILIALRARMREDAPPGAPSNPPPRSPDA